MLFSRQSRLKPEGNMKRSSLLFLVLSSGLFLCSACESPGPAGQDGDPASPFVSAGLGGWELLEILPDVTLRVYGLALPAPERATVRAMYHAVLVDSAGDSRPLPVSGPVQDVRLFSDADSTLVAMLDAGGVLSLWDTRTGKHEALAKSVFPGFSFSPNGDRLAFSAGIIPEMDLHVIRLDTRQILRLTDEDGPTWGPAFSPDGQELLFVSSLGGYASLAVIPAGGGATRRVTNTTLPADGTPVHSSRLSPFPDGRRPALWTDEGFVFESHAGVHQISSSGLITGHWPHARFPVLHQGKLLRLSGRDLVPMERPEVTR
jgi:WD40 repeat protein